MPRRPAIANWLALLLAPSLALTALGVNYALVTPVCEWRAEAAWLHGVFAVSLMLSLLFAALAWRNWHHSRAARATAERRQERERFLALVGVLVASLSALVIAAQWLPLWMLSPCSA